jgi:hypothetical protein
MKCGFPSCIQRFPACQSRFPRCQRRFLRGRFRFPGRQRGFPGGKSGLPECQRDSTPHPPNAEFGMRNSTPQLQPQWLAVRLTPTLSMNRGFGRKIFGRKIEAEIFLPIIFLPFPFPGSWFPCAALEPWRLPMNLCVRPVSAVSVPELAPQSRESRRGRGSRAEIAGHGLWLLSPVGVREFRIVRQHATACFRH